MLNAIAESSWWFRFARCGSSDQARTADPDRPTRRRGLSLGEDQQRRGTDAIVLHRVRCCLGLHELLIRGEVRDLDNQPNPVGPIRVPEGARRDALRSEDLLALSGISMPSGQRVQIAGAQRSWGICRMQADRFRSIAGSPQAGDQAWTARSEATVRLTETIE